MKTVSFCSKCDDPMVSVAHFRADADNLIYEIERRCNEVEENAIQYFIVARNIQRFFRGYITRKHIETLNQSAVCIQKNWRAFSGRRIYQSLLKERYEALCLSYYETMATTIQRHWKGHFVRSRIFSFYKLQSWLEFVNDQNKYLRCLSEKYRSVENQTELQQREAEAKEWIVYILFKLHHLLRTHQISGIYSLPKTRNLSNIEKMLTSLKYKDFMTFYNSYMADVRQTKAREIPLYIFQNCKHLAHFEREWYEHKALHRDPYVDSSIPKDRVTRYDLPESTTQMNATKKVNQVGNCCCCSFCRDQRK